MYMQERAEIQFTATVHLIDYPNHTWLHITGTKAFTLLQDSQPLCLMVML